MRKVEYASAMYSGPECLAICTLYMNYVQDGLHLLRLAGSKEALQCSNMYSYVLCALMIQDALI